MSDGSYSVSDILDYIEFVINNHEPLTTVPSIHFSINRVNNRLVFKLEDEYKLGLETPETMKFFGSTEK